jgi:hypothetical protein
MKRLITIACATAVSLAVFSSCSNDPTVNNNGTGTTGGNLVFQQIDRVGRPGLKELFIPYANHDAFNRAAPTGDASATAPQIATFMASAGRSAAISQYVQDLLTPDALLFNIGNTSTTATYLGYESGGQIASSCTGLAPSAFGGRGLSDDVASVMLGLAYGNLATSATLSNASLTNVFSTSSSATTADTPPADDGAEKNGKNGTPLLASQNLGCADKVTNSNTFPYLTAPI